jgi:hypothetical protein
MENNATKNKPQVKLTGQNGNVFNLMALCRSALRNAGQTKEANEMCDKIYQSGSYDEALIIMQEYCEVE